MALVVARQDVILVMCLLDKCKQQDKASNKTRQDRTNSANRVQSKIRQNKTRQDKTRQDKTRQERTRQDKTRQDKTRQDKTRQDKTRQDKTRQDKTRQETRQQKKTRRAKRLTFYGWSDAVPSFFCARYTWYSRS